MMKAHQSEEPSRDASECAAPMPAPGIVSSGCAPDSQSRDGGRQGTASRAEPEQPATSGADHRRPWLILVAGEHWKTTDGKRWLGQHCSLQWVARCYEQLVDRFGRDRVIVIGQLEQTLAWLKNAASTGVPEFTSGITLQESGRRWSVRHAELRSACTRLLGDGGVDYDGTKCHPATLLDVLTGNARASGGPVVMGGGAVWVGLYSHGWSHEVINDQTPAGKASRNELEARTVCDLCGRPHATAADVASCTAEEHSSLNTREWYMHMEHDTPVERREAARYNYVATEAHEHPYSLLYSTSLIGALTDMFRAEPARPVVVAHNYCGSDGMLKWMRRPSYRAQLPLDKWPLAMMSSAGELEGAIAGSLLPLLVDYIHEWLAARNATFQGRYCRSITLGAAFEEVQREYLRRCDTCLA
eukprot:SAG31_NODE_105_length_25008_cov_17.439399_5_plen_415_part_00